MVKGGSADQSLEEEDGVLPPIADDLLDDLHVLLDLGRDGREVRLAPELTTRPVGSARSTGGRAERERPHLCEVGERIDLGHVDVGPLGDLEGEGLAARQRARADEGLEAIGRRL